MKAMNEFGLSEKCMNDLVVILASIPAIEEAVIYGSRARGDYKPASDIDLTLKGQNLSYKDVALLDDKLYYSYLPYYFDTSIFSTLTNKELIANIKREGKVLYKQNNNGVKSK